MKPDSRWDRTPKNLPQLRRLPSICAWPGGPGRLPAQGSHRSVHARIRAYGSSSNPFAAPAARRRSEPVTRYPSALRSHSTGVQCLPCGSRRWRGYSMPRFPPRGPRGRSFPRFRGTIKALRLPAGPPAALRCLRLAVPREHARFAPAADACGRRRAWGCSPGIPVRVFFRGDGRISQVPGEPQFPFAHALRPRPADASLTVTGRSHGPR